jgi:ceramide glucosyltransferase
VIAIVLLAAAYQILSIIACVRWLLSRREPSVAPLPVSVLKPVRGLDDDFYGAIRSQAAQDHTDFEILFGIANPDDPARAGIERLIAEFPRVPIRLLISKTEAPNAKVGTLIDLAQAAQHSILVVNDSDITVEPDYLRRVTAPLADPSIGLVTCLYRAEGRDWPSRWEALGIMTDFAPSTLVAPLFGVSEFGLGSTLAFRRGDLESIGGFKSIADYIADDYQLGARIHRLGRRNLISRVVVSTRVAAGSWSGAYQHQLRWARTIRLSRLGGYLGLPVTFATLWVVVAALFGHAESALVLLSIRLTAAVVSGWLVLRSADAVRYLWLVPFRDLWGVAVWAAALFGHTVEWRGRRLRLDKQGRIVRA